MTATQGDVIDSLLGITPGSPLDAIRARRPEARIHAQTSWRALFAPEDSGGITEEERFALACYVVGLHGEAETAAFYAAPLSANTALRAAIAAAVLQTATPGPFGSYPAGPLSGENTTGPIFGIDAATRAALGTRLTAAFAQAHMLVLHPRDAAPEDLQGLLDAGWSTTDIVTLSQIVAFLSFQIRAVAGLRVLASAS